MQQKLIEHRLQKSGQKIAKNRQIHICFWIFQLLTKDQQDYKKWTKYVTSSFTEGETVLVNI